MKTKFYWLSEFFFTILYIFVIEISNYMINAYVISALLNCLSKRSLYDIGKLKTLI
jgi:hypothetical protein